MDEKPIENTIAEVMRRIGKFDDSLNNSIEINEIFDPEKIMFSTCEKVVDFLKGHNLDLDIIIDEPKGTYLVAGLPSLNQEELDITERLYRLGSKVILKSEDKNPIENLEGVLNAFTPLEASTLVKNMDFLSKAMTYDPANIMVENVIPGLEKIYLNCQTLMKKAKRDKENELNVKEVREHLTHSYQTGMQVYLSEVKNLLKPFWAQTVTSDQRSELTNTIAHYKNNCFDYTINTNDCVVDESPGKLTYNIFSDLASGQVPNGHKSAVDYFTDTYGVPHGISLNKKRPDKGKKGGNRKFNIWTSEGQHCILFPGALSEAEEAFMSTIAQMAGTKDYGGDDNLKAITQTTLRQRDLGYWAN